MIKYKLKVRYFVESEFELIANNRPRAEKQALELFKKRDKTKDEFDYKIKILDSLHVELGKGNIPNIKQINIKKHISARLDSRFEIHGRDKQIKFIKTALTDVSLIKKDGFYGSYSLVNELENVCFMCKYSPVDGILSLITVYSLDDSTNFTLRNENYSQRKIIDLSYLPIYYLDKLQKQ